MGKLEKWELERQKNRKSRSEKKRVAVRHRSYYFLRTFLFCLVIGSCLMGVCPFGKAVIYQGYSMV